MEKAKIIEELLKYRYAHRGFHNGEDAMENSMTAFKKAIDEGFGIEFDVHLTKDKRLAVIHDSSLKRTLGVDLIIEDITLDEARKYTLGNTQDKIVTLDDILTEVNGKIPLLVELKAAEKNYMELTDIAMKSLLRYQGLYCVESFHPGIVKYLKKKYPNVVRGQLAGALNKHEKVLSNIEDFLLRNLIVNIQGKPDFVSYHFEDRNEKAFLKYKGAKFTWTVKSYEDMLASENMGAIPIFEGFNPKEL